ncbi:hypothetical protein EJB05_21416 [Eragrostis curvula]|uniref:Uncharacterized protein n=1 Tax=Eragrostis curvula TaxID=38414 RepID=A0A5J9V128_9POAL|nr:hypothetical protein EJB05_21416 [Eragrostis curvula]
MDHAKPKVDCVCASSDRISSLPPEIKGHILSNLNVEEAVRTSILSSEWRDAWTVMPKINLNDSLFGFPNGRFKFVTLVDMVLSLHKGPIESFAIVGNKSYNDVFDRWMYMLSKKKTDYIIIKLTSGPKYKIPSRFFFISVLERLRVKNCIISLPRGFEGFKLLTLLNLKSFSSTDSDINNLISSCPRLKMLLLRYFEGLSCLNIRAPELEALEIVGNFKDLHLHTPNLEQVYLKHIKVQSVPLDGASKSYLKQAFGSLTRIKRLLVSNTFLMYLSKGCILTKLPCVFDHLEEICITGRLWNSIEVLAAWSLFQNAPYLRKLGIWSNMHDDLTPKGIWDGDHTKIQGPTMDHLLAVNVHDFMGFDCEIAFLGLLLSWAPALEEMKIDVPENMTDQCICKATKKLLAFPRASTKAKIMFI